MSRNPGVLFIILSAACYGAMPLFAKLAYASGVAPITLLFLRFAFAAPVMLALVAVRRVRLPRGRELLALVGLGGVVYVAQALCYFTALTKAPASLVALILYLYPVLVATLVFGERFALVRAGALVLALGGSALMIGFARAGSAAGVILAVAAAAIYAIYILMGTSVMKRVPPLAAATVVICSTAVVYGGITAATGPAWPGTLTGWLSIAALSLVSTVGAIALFFAGLERVGPTSASILSTFEPAVAVALAVLFLGEALTPVRMAGGALVLAAVVITALGGPSRPASS